jgi:hypothetical protein
MTVEVTSLEKAAKILGINLDEQPNIFSNGWPDRLPLNDIAKLQLPDDVTYHLQLSPILANTNH